MKIQFPNANEQQIESLKNQGNIPLRSAENGQTTKGLNSMMDSFSVFIPQKDQMVFSNTVASKASTLAQMGGQAQGQMDVMQDYQVLMAHTLSKEDYAELSKEGFPIKSMAPEETVTIVDKIKAELVKSGKQIAGYTDDLDMETLAAALGSQGLAMELTQNFASYDIPMTDENIELTKQAYDMLQELKAPTEGSMHFMIANELEPEIQNLYLAQSSGAGLESPGNAKYMAEDVEGYFVQNGNGHEMVKDNVAQADAGIWNQIDQVIAEADLPVNEESRQDASWLLDQNLPITKETLKQYEELKDIELPISDQEFAKAVADALSYGKLPMEARVINSVNVYEKALAVLDRYQNVEEVRLHMTAEVNVKLLKRGFSFDTAPIEQVIDAVKQAKEEIAKQYFPETEDAIKKYDDYEKVNEYVKEFPSLPGDLLTIEDFAQKTDFATATETGQEMKQRYERAGESYEPLMTAPRADLGDSMKKAFGNVDVLLKEIGYEETAENEKAVRILGYNRMEITAENVDRMKAVQQQVSDVIHKMTPASVLKMIRDGVNPLEKSFDELKEYFDRQPQEYEKEAESYSRFLYRLEQRNDITQEERESYIGVYRLITQIEKNDGAALGMLVQAQAEVQFSTILSAIRSGKAKNLDVKVTESFGGVTDLLSKGESISDQILKAFAQQGKEALEALTQLEEGDKALVKEEMELMKQAAISDQEVTKLLTKAQLSGSVDNMMAAKQLLKKDSVEYRRWKEKLDFHKLSDTLEDLDEPESFQEKVAIETKALQQAVEEATFTEESAVNVKAMQLLYKQLSVASSLSESQEYVLPMYVGDEIVKVHLTIEESDAQKGQISISMALSEKANLEAKLEVKNGNVGGYLTGNFEGEVMNPQRIVDIFSNIVKEDGSYRMDAQLSILGSAQEAENGRPVIGKGVEALKQSMSQTTDTNTPPDHVALYRVAKWFLQAAKEGTGI